MVLAGTVVFGGTYRIAIFDGMVRIAVSDGMVRILMSERPWKFSSEVRRSSFMINELLEVVMKKREKCDCCFGTGLCTTFFVDDFSPCMNCNGKGYFEYDDGKDSMDKPPTEAFDQPARSE